MRTRTKVIGAIVVVAAALSIGSVTAQDTSTGSLKKEQLQRLYTEYLSTEGYKPEVNSDGLVLFKREGRVYVILVSETDSGFFHLVLPNICKIEHEKKRAQVLAAADFSNANSKVCKVYTVQDQVWVSIEIFVKSPEDFKGGFERAMGAMDIGLNNFVLAMREKSTLADTPSSTVPPQAHAR
jgi:hypothetical protein